MKELHLIDIAKRCIDKRKELEAAHKHSKNTTDQFTTNFKWTQADFGIFPTTENALIKLLGRKANVGLINLGSFVNLYKHCTSRKCITELAIPVRTQQLVQVFHSHTTVSTVIDLAEKVGLLKCVEPKYCFNGNRQDNSAKRYIYNKKVQDLILAIVKMRGIKIKEYQKKNRVEALNAKVNAVPEKIKQMIRVGTNLRIASCNLNDDTVRAILDTRYPMVKRCQELADIDNQKLCAAEQIKCDWNITRTEKNITKIGFRATSGIVSLKEHENENPNYSGVWRKDYLAERFNGKKVYSFDVKSSIFRVTFWLNFGIWLDNDIDLYELMYGSKFASDPERLAYKVFKMRTYFDKGNAIVSHIMPIFKGVDKADLLKLVDADVARQEKVIGKSFKSEVFVYESCLYMELVHRLREAGIDVVQVYDGFYSDNPELEAKSKEILQKIVSEIEKKYSEYFQINQTSTLKSEIQNHIQSMLNQISINSDNIQNVSVNDNENAIK